jgi:hypothetical protein
MPRSVYISGALTDMSEDQRAKLRTLDLSHYPPRRQNQLLADSPW